jgi:hypothetical protein
MKYLKLFENKEDFKKYVLILSDTKLSIIEILESYNADIGKVYNFKTLYRMNENGVKKQQEYNPNVSLTLRYSFIIKHMVEESNDLQELINKMEVVYNQMKYNL